MSISRETLNSRRIRERILAALDTAYGSMPEIGLLADHVYDVFSGGVIQQSKSQIDGELYDLLRDGLIECVDAPSLEPPAKKAYRITSRGRDFVRARFPWRKIDEYTGQERST